VLVREGEIKIKNKTVYKTNAWKGDKQSGSVSHKHWAEFWAQFIFSNESL